ncbi:hypothetical protein V5F49_18760 [Xanthobacter sp. V3C-3]|uniref:hypothetical protein n=1 Tax=Xanthobacter lutulentifluminis TaxID=3119935 RepID=UPI0037293869
MAVTVHSRGSGGETYEITLEKTGPDSGRIAIRSWTAGRPVTSAPDSVEAYPLTHVRAQDGGRLLCKADVAALPDFLDPVVMCRLEPNPGASPLVRIQVGFKTFAYPLSPDDFKLLASFIQAARFPR